MPLTTQPAIVYYSSVDTPSEQCWTPMELLVQSQAIDIPEQTIEEEYEQMDLLEEAIHSMGNIELPVVHKFQTGMYIREMTMPAGALITSVIHATPHVVIVSKGAISVWTAGRGHTYIEAPFAFVSEPGTRRVGFAHEETVWATIHQTYETDIPTLEKMLVIPRASPQERLALKE